MDDDRPIDKIFPKDQNHNEVKEKQENDLTEDTFPSITITVID